MTITLVPENETLLQERVKRDGQDVDTLANALLADSLRDDEAAREAAFDQALLAAGIIIRIPPPRDPSKAERPRIQVLGEPLSETIIRERR